LTEKKEPKRWLMWSALALAFVIVYMHRVAPSVVADQLMQSFNVKDGAVLGSLAAMYFYVYMVMQIPAGVLVDTFGPRITVTVGIVVAGAGSIVFAAAPVLGQAFLGRFLVGLGVSVVFVSILKFQSVWFLAGEFAFLTGMTQLVGNAGAVLAATPLALLVNLSGWRFSFYLIGFISFFAAVNCWLLVRNSKQSVEEPPQKSVPARLYENMCQMSIVIKNRQCWPPFVVMFGVYGTLIAFSGIWGVPYLMQVYQLTRTTAANLMLMIALGMMVGSPFIGYLSDRLMLRKLPYAGFVIMYVLFWALMILPNAGRPPLAILYPLYFVLGFFGSVVCLTFAIAKEVNSPSVTGMAFATLNMGGFLGISVLQPLIGYFLDLRWDGVLLEGVKIYPQEAYYFAFGACLLPLCISVIAALMVKETRGKNCYQG
jgi:MFS family permease